MKALLAFSGGGGSGFPGTPYAGVYPAGTNAEFLSICAEVVTTPLSIVCDFSISSLFWFATGDSMYLFGGNVMDISEAPTPGTFGGVTFVIDQYVAIYDESTAQFHYYDGSDWIPLS